jgi:hypothetical protein
MGDARPVAEIGCRAWSRSPLLKTLDTMTLRYARRAVFARLCACSIVTGTLVGCHEPATVPIETEAIAPAIQVARIACVADARARIVACRAPSASTESHASGDLILGGQHTFVNLSSSNIAYAGDVFSFDVTVQNLIVQTLGTVDGTTLDTAGVRVFFDAAPTTLSGTGTIDFIDPVTSSSMVDGYATFTGSSQPYYRYIEMLARNQTSSAKRWRLHVPASVATFGFAVYVSAPVQFPVGYVTLSSVSTNPKPTQTRTLTAIVTDAVGRTISGAPVSWSSNAPAVATVDASGVVTAVSSGMATITATSATRTASRTITVVGSTWLGSTSDDFSDASNWSGSVVPTASDSILIPKLVPRIPRLTAATAAASVELEPGASLDLNGQDLTVSDQVKASTVAAGGGISNGTLRLTGTSTSTLVGRLPTTTILGSPTSCGGAQFSLSGATSSQGSITTNCPLTIGTNALTTAGDLTTARSGALIQGSPSAVVNVGATMTFGGASESGLLTAGMLTVKGDFFQLGSGGATSSFVAGTGYLVQLNGTSTTRTQEVRFDNPGPSASRFANLEIDNASAVGVTFTSSVDVTGSLEQKGRLTIDFPNVATIEGTSSFRSGAVTGVAGTLGLAVANFYNGSKTTGAGTLTTGASSCFYGTTVGPSDLYVGSFTLLTCIPGRITLP